VLIIFWTLYAHFYPETCDVVVEDKHLHICCTRDPCKVRHNQDYVLFTYLGLRYVKSATGSWLGWRFLNDFAWRKMMFSWLLLLGLRYVNEKSVPVRTSWAVVDLPCKQFVSVRAIYRRTTSPKQPTHILDDNAARHGQIVEEHIGKTTLVRCISKCCLKICEIGQKRVSSVMETKSESRIIDNRRWISHWDGERGTEEGWNSSQY